jgi:hypothetical protein
MQRRFLISTCILTILGSASAFSWFPVGRVMEQATIPGARAYAQLVANSNSMPARQANQLNQIKVGTNVQVSKARENQPHQEVILAADPTNPRHLLAASMLQYPPSRTNKCIAYESRDGGGTWRIALEPAHSIPSIGYMSDPTVAFGPEGEAYFGQNAIPSDSKIDDGTDIVYRQLPQHSWSSPTTIAAGMQMDRPYLVVDQTRGKFRGRLYCGNVNLIDALPGTGGTMFALGFYTSVNRGATFSLPTLKCFQIASNQVDAIDGNSVVLSDGTVVLPYSIQARAQIPNDDKVNVDNTSLIVIRSLDGGKTIERIPPRTDTPKPGEKHVVPRQYITSFHRTRSSVHLYNIGLPCLAVDSSALASKDHLYIVWTTDREDGFHAMFSSSQDKGFTWSAPIQIDDAPRTGGTGSRVNAFMPEIAVNSSGVIGVSWYDTRGLTGDQVGWNLRFTASLNGGKTWLPSQRVSESSTRFPSDKERSIPHQEGFVSDLPFLVGDTAGLATDTNGVFHALWIDNRTGLRQVWTAAVTVSANP